MRHTILLEAWYDGDWHPVPTNNRAEVVITEGRQDQLQRMSPTQMTIEINNRDGMYSPRNPLSPLYGKIGPGTRVRLTVDGEVEFIGDVESWPLRWSRGVTDMWVPLTARGVTYRLGLPGSKARAASAMRRIYDPTISARVGRPTPLAFWPLGGPEVAVGKARTAVLRQNGASGFDRAEMAPWLERGVALDASATLTCGGIVMNSTPAGYSVEFLYAGSTGRLTLIGRGAAADAGIRFEIYMLATALSDVTLRVYSDGAEVGQITSLGLNEVNDNLPFFNKLAHHVRVTAEQDGSDTKWAVYIDGSLTEGAIGTALGTDPITPAPSTTLTIPSTTLTPLDRIVATHQDPGGDPGAVGLSTLAVWDESPADIADVVWAAKGYAGEQAHQRIERICLEEGIACTIVGDTLGSERVGPQPVDTPLEIMFDAAAVDMGMLYEPRDVYGIGYRVSRSLYNLPPAATLTWGQREIGGLDPADDLDLVTNDVTVTSTSTGSSARAVKETGPLNVQEPVDDPQGVGRISTNYDINVADDSQLTGQAAWRLHLGTWDEQRYPLLIVDLDALASQGKQALAADLADAQIGQMIRIDTSAARPTGLHSHDIELHIQGTTQRVSGEHRTIEINAVPYGPWAVGTYQDGSASGDVPRYDTEWSFTAADFDTSSLPAALTVTTTIPPLWTTAAAELPLLVEVRGVTLTVTGISGSSSPQTFTISAADVPMVIPAGAHVRVKRPARYALN